MKVKELYKQLEHLIDIGYEDAIVVENSKYEERATKIEIGYRYERYNDFYECWEEEWADEDYYKNHIDGKPTNKLIGKAILIR